MSGHTERTSTKAMTLAQAEKKHGENLWNHTSSQTCQRCSTSIFTNDFIGAPQPEELTCPNCGQTTNNLFFRRLDK